VAAGLALLVAQGMSRSQPATAIRRIGYLGATQTAVGTRLRDAFKAGMRQLGWVEGSNIEYHFAFAAGEIDRLNALADDLISRNVDVIVTTTPQALSAAQRATKTIPIVTIGGSNSVSSGFVARLAKPGGNVTGLSFQYEDLLGKLIELLHEIVPSARRVAVLLNEGNPSHALFWAAAQAGCAAIGLVAYRVVANSPAQFASAADEIVGQRAQAVVVPAEIVYLAELAKLQEVMQATGLPVAYGLRAHVVAGGLLSYASDLVANYRYVAKWVDKILKGAKPADLPIEQPTKFELVINAKTARALGLTIPHAVLLRADEVIE